MVFVKTAVYNNIQGTVLWLFNVSHIIAIVKTPIALSFVVKILTSLWINGYIYILLNNFAHRETKIKMNVTPIALAI